MNHTAVVANLSIYSPANTFLKTNYPNITFLLGETNSDYTNLLMSQVEGVFGSSLWLIDYLMYGMSLVRKSYTHPAYEDNILIKILEYHSIQSHSGDHIRIYRLGTCPDR
jgi:hypothetical protein